eukprot:12550924-Alexandrium_andersonii.AAC.1
MSVLAFIVDGVDGRFQVRPLQRIQGRSGSGFLGALQHRALFRGYSTHVPGAWPPIRGATRPTQHE